jgi:hypothetical protein
MVLKYKQMKEKYVPLPYVFNKMKYIKSILYTWFTTCCIIAIGITVIISLTF